MSQPTKQVAVRLSLDLHAKIVATAAANNRSGHAEMLHRLEASFSEPASAGQTVVEAAELTEVFTTCFSSLEERVLAMLDHPMRHIYSVSIPGDGTIGPGFDFNQGSRASSLTGRLSDPQPELQDLPAVSGMSTLAASLRKLGCVCGGGRAGFHTGGYTSNAALKDGEVPAILAHGCHFTGLPEGEVPPLLEKGETVRTLTEDLTIGGFIFGPGTRITRTGEHEFQSTVTVLNHVGNLDAQPFAGLNWVITGSLETMTRDRAREIIMDLGGGVAGAVDRNTHALVWGPGAGSKKTRAEQLGVQQYTERQFIERIRSLGVDMPMPTDAERWIENTGSCPVQPAVQVEIKVGDHLKKIGQAGEFVWTLEDEPEVGDITHWRLAK